MLIQQISVFIENKPGAFLKPLKALANSGIEICGMSFADADECGILRMVTRDNNRAIEILNQNNATYKTVDMIGIEAADSPGGLANVLETFAAEQINIKYLYSFTPHQKDCAVILFKVKEPAEALKKLKKHNLKFATKIQ
jgi:hypothetical protein